MVNVKDPRAAEVLRFWFGEGADYGKARKAWFQKNPEFDREIRTRFSTLYEGAASGALDAWQALPGECLALVIALDQFPRNLHRGDAKAFASDGRALGAARHAIASGYDEGMLPVERLFLYLPFEHSENRDDQALAIELIGRLGNEEWTRFASDHKAMIDRFGRFPHRNAILGRASTAEELAALEERAEWWG